MSSTPVPEWLAVRLSVTIVKGAGRLGVADDHFPGVEDLQTRRRPQSFGVVGPCHLVLQIGREVIAVTFRIVVGD